VKFEMSISSNNDAMSESEIVRILQKIVSAIEFGIDTRNPLPILDFNGNTVGEWQMSSDWSE
jgi:hypothetical protein